MSGKKCYYKYPRNPPRYFKPCDVARIAQNCVQDNDNIGRAHVLACVANALGFDHICLSLAEYNVARGYRVGGAVEQTGEVIERVEGKTIETIDDLTQKLLDNLGLGGFVDTGKIPSDVRGTGTTLRANRIGAIIVAALALAETLRRLLPPIPGLTIPKNDRKCYPVNEVLIPGQCQCKKTVIDRIQTLIGDG